MLIWKRNRQIWTINKQNSDNKFVTMKLNFEDYRSSMYVITTNLPPSKCFCHFLLISRIHPPLITCGHPHWSSPGFLLDYCKSLLIAISAFQLFLLGISQNNLDIQISSYYFTIKKSSVPPHFFYNESQDHYFELAFPLFSLVVYHFCPRFPPALVTLCMMSHLPRTLPLLHCLDNSYTSFESQLKIHLFIESFPAFSFLSRILCTSLHQFS